MIDISFAFGDAYQGVSFWKSTERGVQCNIKKSNGGFTIDYGATPEEAWENAKAQAQGERGRPSAAAPKKVRREIEDLA